MGNDTECGIEWDGPQSNPGGINLGNVNYETYWQGPHSKLRMDESERCDA